MTKFSRRNLVLASSIIAFSFASAVPGFAQGAAKSPAKPNIVIFLADDLSYGDVSINGDANVRTPALQRLASEGMSFDRAFVASPACAPSRAALLTGMMPARNGAEANHDRANAAIRNWWTCLRAKANHSGPVSTGGTSMTLMQTG